MHFLEEQDTFAFLQDWYEKMIHRIETYNSKAFKFWVLKTWNITDFFSVSLKFMMNIYPFALQPYDETTQ